MKTYQTGGGYFYKIYKNGKKVRISKEKFMKLKGNKQRGGVRLSRPSAIKLIDVVLDTLDDIAKPKQGKYSTLSGRAYLNRLHKVIVDVDDVRNKTDFIGTMQTLGNHNLGHGLSLLNNERHTETLKICITAILSHMKTSIEYMKKNNKIKYNNTSNSILTYLKNYFKGSSQVDDIVRYADSLLNPNNNIIGAPVPGRRSNNTGAPVPMRPPNSNRSANTAMNTSSSPRTVRGRRGTTTSSAVSGRRTPARGRR